LIRNEKHTTFINEAGLYEFIFSSKKESAKKFKKWVFEELLPTIRKTG
jgi:prophage antirepressor-like protein